MSVLALKDPTIQLSIQNDYSLTNVNHLLLEITSNGKVVDKFDMRSGESSPGVWKGAGLSVLDQIDANVVMRIYMAPKYQLLSFIELTQQELCGMIEGTAMMEIPLISCENYPPLVLKAMATVVPQQELEDVWNGAKETPTVKMFLEAGDAVRDFKDHGNMKSLDQAISKIQLVIGTVAEDDPLLPSMLAGLGTCLLDRFEHSGHSADLDEANARLQKVVDLGTRKNSIDLTSLNGLGNSFILRFNRDGNLADLDKAITNFRRAVELASEDDPQRGAYFSGLGSALDIRFEHLGDLADIDNGIAHHQVSVDSTPDGDPARVRRLGNLGLSLQMRFTRLGNISDLNRAIEYQQMAVDLTPDQDVQKAIFLTNLGLSLHIRFGHLNDLADLDLAIAHQRAAINLTLDGHHVKPNYLTNLGSSLMKRFNYLKDPKDIDEAITAQRAAVNQTLDGQPRKSDYLANLALGLANRFNYFRDTSDINDAIVQIQLALDRRPEDSPSKPGNLASLGRYLWHRSEHLRDRNDAELSMHYFSIAAKSPYGPPKDRFSAAEVWAFLASRLNDESLLAAYECALSLMPLVAWLGFSVTDRHQHLVEIGGTAREAAAAAISLGEYDKAFEWLEQGRSIVWTQILQLRTPVNRLSEIDPALADRLVRVSRQLDSTHGQDNPKKNDHRSTEEEGRKYRALVAEWEAIIKQVRSLPDFQDFLRPPRISKLLEVARNGPVVVFNIARERCDALALVDGLEEVVHIALPNITADKVVELRDRLKGLLLTNGIRMREERAAKMVEDDGNEGCESECEQILVELWNGIVKPVLESLAFSPHPDSLSRIWWCATGPLAFLPLHAAGIYSPEAINSKVSDYVISSYTPTVSSLLEPSNSKMSSSFRLLSVIEPSAPGASYIPNTKDELDHIRRHLVNRDHVVLESADATKSRVVQAMDDANWLHLACHGVQKPIQPTKSALLLHDGHLKLEEIIRLRPPTAEFAFLSACQTTTGDEALSEEAVHIAGGMLLAGYRSVVATMWSIQDELAPVVTDEFYAYIMQRKERPNNRMAAEALHYSVQKLRQKKEIPLTAWIPFVHLGI